MLIDLPQVVDVIGNPQGVWFLRRGTATRSPSSSPAAAVETADGELLAIHLTGLANPA